MGKRSRGGEVGENGSVIPKRPKEAERTYLTIEKKRYAACGGVAPEKSPPSPGRRRQGDLMR